MRPSRPFASACTDSGTFELSSFDETLKEVIPAEAISDDQETQSEVKNSQNRRNGFTNQGASCYQNSAFHFVNSMADVREAVFKAANSKTLSMLSYGDQLIRESEKIFTHILYGESPFNASSFMATLR